jgi:hypothetical protein
LEDNVKKFVALLVLLAMAAAMFACTNASAHGTTAGSTASQTGGMFSTAKPTVPNGDLATPYADIDFLYGVLKDSKGVVTLTINNEGEADAASIEKVKAKFMGKEKLLPVLSIKKAGSWVKGEFSEFENGAEFDAFVAENGGFSAEVFYLNNSATGANCGIVCSTESIGGDGKRSGWGLAESADGAPYFITGHADENVYSSVYASPASAEEFVHVVGVYNAETRRISIYVNGALVSSDSAAGKFTSANKTEAYEGFNMATVFYIGADPSASSGKPEKCDFPADDLMVLDVKFYACALTGEQVKAAFAQSAKFFD